MGPEDEDAEPQPPRAGTGPKEDAQARAQTLKEAGSPKGAPVREEEGHQSRAQEGASTPAGWAPALVHEDQLCDLRPGKRKAQGTSRGG